MYIVTVTFSINGVFSVSSPLGTESMMQNGTRIELSHGLMDAAYRRTRRVNHVEIMDYENMLNVPWLFEELELEGIVSEGVRVTSVLIEDALELM